MNNRIKEFCKTVVSFNNHKDLLMYLFNLVKGNSNATMPTIPDILDKKTFNVFLVEFAKHNSKEITMHFIDLVYKAGHCLSTLKHNVTLTLEDFMVDDDIKQEYKAVLKQQTKIVDKDLVLKRYLEKAKENLKQRNSTILDIIQSGARSSDTQLRQIILSRGMLDTGFNTEFVEGCYFDGLSIHDFEISSLAARKALYDKTMSTAKPGYLTRQLVYALSHIYIDSEDCGTKEYMPYKITQDNYKSFYGKYYFDIETNTEKVMHNPEQFINKIVPVRSPFLCKSQNVCRKCIGEYYYDFKHVGIITAQTIGERATQLTLRVFHTGSAVSLQSDIMDIVKQYPDYIDLHDRIITVKQEAELILPPDTIISKNTNIILHDVEVMLQYSDGTVIRFTIMQGSKLLVQPGKVKGNIIQLIPLSITNAIVAIENFLKMKLSIENLNQLLKIQTILYKLITYDSPFPYFMYELLLLSQLTNQNNKPFYYNRKLEFPLIKQPLKNMPMLLGIGLLFENPRKALRYMIQNKDGIIANSPLKKLLYL